MFNISLGLILVAAASASAAAQERGTPPSPVPSPSPASAPVPGVRPGGFALGEAVRVGGYGSMRFEANSLDEPKASGFELRRFVLTTDVTPTDRFRGYVEIEFERLGSLEVERSVARSEDGIKFKEELEGGGGGEISIEQMWGQFKIAEPLSLRAGAVLPPLGRFNIAHDDDRWDLPRRSLVDRGAPVLPVHAAWTELGAGLVGGFAVGSRGQLSYQAYAVNGALLDFTVEKAIEAEAHEPGILKLATEVALSRGPVNGEGGTRAGTWRVAYSPTLSTEIAVSGYHGRYTPEFLGPVRERINALSVDGMFRRGGFALEGEYVHSDFGDTDRVLQGFVDAVTGSTGIAPAAGAEGTEAEFAIKGLARTRHGFWVEARYRFWPGAWHGGVLGRGFENPQITPVIRYERVTLTDAVAELAIENGDIAREEAQTPSQERATLGLSYRPLPTVVFTVAVERNRRRRGDALVFPSGVSKSSYTSVLAGLAFGF